MNQKPDIIISKHDLEQIEELLAKSPKQPECVDALEQELARAQVVASQALPAHVVAIGSTVTFKIVASGATFTKVLCLPANAANTENGISVFAPIGAAILGLAEGQQIEWESPRGLQLIEIIKVAHG